MDIDLGDVHGIRTIETKFRFNQKLPELRHVAYIISQRVWRNVALVPQVVGVVLNENVHGLRFENNTQ
jgi:hypothetical protein